jgi:GNAT superfamily N-acetyltransferase
MAKKPTSENLVVRLLSPNNYFCISELERRFNWEMHGMNRKFGFDGAKVFAAVDGRRYVGYCAVIPQKQLGTITDIYVEYNSRRHGYGSAMLGTIKKHLQPLGIKQLVAVVPKRTEDFYKKNEFNFAQNKKDGLLYKLSL